MILTVVLSHFAFGKEPHLNFYFAMALIINAIVLYNLPAAAPSTALVPPATAVTLPTSHRERSSIQEGDALAAQSSLLETEAESE